MSTTRNKRRQKMWDSVSLVGKPRYIAIRIVKEHREQRLIGYPLQYGSCKTCGVSLGDPCVNQAVRGTFFTKYPHAWRRRLSFYWELTSQGRTV